MSKIENLDILEYVNNENIFTETERDMFFFLVESIPENILNIQEENETGDIVYRENKELLTLVTVLSRVLGESREFVLNLEKAHDLPGLIRDIKIAIERDLDPALTVLDSEGNPDPTLKYERLKDSNKRLLAILVEELGFEVDFNQITRDVDNTYLKELETYFNLIVNQYETIKNRGSNSALYQILRYYNEIDTTLGFPTLEILEQGEIDDKAPESSGLEVVPVGSVRMHLTSVPENYAKLPGSGGGEVPIFDPSNSLFYLDSDTELYKLIMGVKPAGIFYEMVVKATFYLLYTADRVMAGKDSYIEQENGFRIPQDIQTILSSLKITYRDDITSITNLKVELKLSSNINYDTSWDLELKAFDSGEDTTKANINKETNKNKNVVNTHNLNVSTILESESITDLKKVLVEIDILDSYDHNNKDTRIVDRDIPEIVKDTNLDLDTSEGSYVHGESYELLIDLKNNLNRQQVKEITTVFEQRDEYANKDHTLPKQTNIVASGERQLSLINNTDKIWRGTLKTQWVIERLNGVETVTKTITKSIPLIVKDKYSRGLFTLFINDLIIDSNYGVTFKVVNPNTKTISFDLGVEWRHSDETQDTYKEVKGVSVGSDTYVSYNYSIVDGSGLYGNIGTQDRAKAKKVRVLVEPLDEEIEEYPDIKVTSLKNPVSAITYTPDQSPATKHVTPLISGGVKVVDVATKNVGGTLRVDYIKNYLDGELLQKIPFTDSSKKTNYIRLSNTKVHETDGVSSTAIASFVDTTLDNTDLDGSGTYNLNITQDLSGSEFIFKTPILGGSPSPSYFLQSNLEINIGHDAEPRYYSTLRNSILNTKTISMPTLTGLVINDFWVEAELYEGAPRYIARIKVTNNSGNTYNLRGKYYEGGWQDIAMPQINPQSTITYTVYTYGFEAPDNNVNRLFVVFGDLISGHSDRNNYLLANSVWDNVTRVETLTLKDPILVFKGFTNINTEFKLRINNPNTVPVNYRYYLNGAWVSGVSAIAAGANLDLTLDRATTSKVTIKVQFIDVSQYNNSAEIAEEIPKFQRLSAPQITYVGTVEELMTGILFYEISIYNPNSVAVELYTSLGENDDVPWTWGLETTLTSKQTKTVSGLRPGDTKEAQKEAFDFFALFKTDDVTYYESFVGEKEIPEYEEKLLTPTISIKERNKTSVDITVNNPNAVYGDIYYNIYQTTPGSYIDYGESVGANTSLVITIPIAKDITRKVIIKLVSADYKDSDSSNELSIGLFIPPQLMAPIMSVVGTSGQYYQIDIDNPNDVPALLYIRVGTEGAWEDTNIEVYPDEDLKNIDLPRHTPSAFTIFARYGDATPEQDNYANSEIVGPFNVVAVTQLLTPTISDIQRTQIGYSFKVNNPNNEQVEIEYKKPGDIISFDGGVVAANSTATVTVSEGPAPTFNLIARLVGSPTKANSEYTAQFTIPKPNLLTPQVEYVSTTATKYTIKVTNTNDVPVSVYFRHGEGSWGESGSMGVSPNNVEYYTLNRPGASVFSVDTKFTSINTNDSATKTETIKAYIVLSAPILSYVIGSRTQDSYKINVSNTNSVGAVFLYGLNGDSMVNSAGSVDDNTVMDITLDSNTENSFTLKGYFQSPGDGYGDSVASVPITIPQYVQPKLTKPTLTYMISDGATYTLQVSNSNQVPVAYHNKKGVEAWVNTGEIIPAQSLAYVTLARTDLAYFTVKGKVSASGYQDSDESAIETVPAFVPTKLTKPTISELTYTYQNYSFKVTNLNNVEVSLYSQYGAGGYIYEQKILGNGFVIIGPDARPTSDSFDIYFKFDDVDYWTASDATKLTVPKAQLLAPTNVYTFNETNTQVSLNVDNPNSVGAEIWVSVDGGSSYSKKDDVAAISERQLIISRPGGVSGFTIRVIFKASTTHLDSTYTQVIVPAYVAPQLIKPGLSSVVLTGPNTYTVDISNSNGKTVNVYYRQGSSGGYTSGGTVGTGGKTLTLTRGTSSAFTLYMYFNHADNTDSENATINIPLAGTWTLTAPSMTRTDYTNTKYSITISNPNDVAVSYYQKDGSGSYQSIGTITAFGILVRNNLDRTSSYAYTVSGKLSASGYVDSGEGSVSIPAATWTVTFKDWSGTTLKTEYVDHGQNATPPTQPNPGTGYDWAGWSGTYTNVTSDRTITAQRTIKTFTVTFIRAWNGTTIKTQTVNYGGNATFPTSGEIGYGAGYEYDYYTGTYTNVTSNRIITIYRKSSVVYVTITWRSYAGLESDDTVPQGTTVYAPSGTPDNAEWAYSWPVNSVVANSNQTIQETRAKKSYTVTWSAGAGGTLSYYSSEVNYGVVPSAPSGTRVGFNLTGWTPTRVAVTGPGASYTAVWTAQTLKWVYDKKINNNPYGQQGIDLIGTYCSPQNSTMLVDGNDIGYGSGTHQLICK